MEKESITKAGLKDDKSDSIEDDPFKCFQMLATLHKSPIYNSRHASFDPNKFLEFLKMEKEVCAGIAALIAEMGAEFPTTLTGPEKEYLKVLKELGETSAEISTKSARTANWVSIYRPLQSLEQVLGGGKGWKAKAIKFAEDTARLIPLLCDRSGSQKDQQDSARECFGLASNLAVVVLEVGGSASIALRILEFGRGIITNLQLERRAPVDQIRSKSAALATEFERLQAQLDSIQLTTSAGGTYTQLCEVCQKLDDLILEIHKVPGLESFLRPATEDEIIKTAAEGTIVVINVSLRCDAILIRASGITSLRLPQVSHSEIMRFEPSFRRPNPMHGKTPGQDGEDGPRPGMDEALEWLWISVASPILNELGFKTTPQAHPWPRVWWIATGMLASFPIHAAGLRDEHEKASTSAESVLDRVISSYSTSIKALIYTRQNQSKVVSGNEPNRKAVLLWSPANDLTMSKGEVDGIKAALGEVGEESVTEQISSKEITKGYIEGCTIFHFSGHGYSVRSEPSKSYLRVVGGVVTVSELLAMKLHERPPFLAYLSACETGDVGERTLGDEGIHLIGACQLAGFRHVIGSLWMANDATSATLAQKVYEIVKTKDFEYQSVSFGLHEAVRAARDIARDWARNGNPNGGRGSPFLWAPYIHVGI